MCEAVTPITGSSGRSYRWEPRQSLRAGLEPTYKWIEVQVMRNVAPETRSSGDAREVHTAFARTG